MKALAFVGHFAAENVTLSDSVGGHLTQGQILDVAREVADALGASLHFPLHPVIIRPSSVVGESAEVFAVVLAIDDTRVTPLIDRDQRDYVALLFSARTFGQSSTRDLETLLSHAALMTFGAFYQALRFRVRLFSPFPSRVSERFWHAALQPAAIPPPWERTSNCQTVTLSIDLRKSTFCMEQAVSARKFAMWIDQLVQIVLLIGQRSGGIFDKFTGDGALIHFLDDDCTNIYGYSAATKATECAAAMHFAIEEVHLPRLRSNLRFDSDLLGAAIGIDQCEASWSLDHRMNPIVVGRGVVNACRLSGGPSGTTRLSNAVYQRLSYDVREVSNLRRTILNLKDFSSAIGLAVWEGSSRNGGFANATEITDLCKAVYRSHGDDHAV